MHKRETCLACGVGSASEVIYQPKERPNDRGEWVDVGGREFVTCKWGKPDCPARGHTVTRERQQAMGAASHE